MAYGLPDWLTGSSSQPSPGTETASGPKATDGGFVAPDRNRREACYESRDIFFKCLDKHDILDANEEDEKSRQLCPKEVEGYERDCARSWIKYFKDKRVVDAQRDAQIKKYQEEDSLAAAKARGRKGFFG